jgi:three-Cys-motif partner protein
MAAPRSIVWEMEPHTAAKHAILKRYLQAWMVILSQGKFREILYIDGFAGPGEYKNGEVGSPIIALQNALNYRPPLTAILNFLFVEKDPARAAHLKSLIDKMGLPSNFHVKVEGGTTFENAFAKHYLTYQRYGKLIPTFAFIDPFGWTGAPMSIVQAIMKHKSCEVFVNFMYEEINRFISHPDQKDNFDSLFGTSDWERCKAITGANERRRCLHDLYTQQMCKQGNVVHARSFAMSNDKDVTDYILFYGTNELLGLKKMKEAMWKVDESGGFSFSDATDPRQTVLFGNEPNLAQLKSDLLRKFKGMEPTVGDIERFVVVETAFRETHYKKVLRSMEIETQEIRVTSAPDKRKLGQYGSPDIRIVFS